MDKNNDLTRNIIDANVDDDCPWFDPRTFDKFGLANSSDDDIGVFHLLCKRSR